LLWLSFRAINGEKNLGRRKKKEGKKRGDAEQSRIIIGHFFAEKKRKASTNKNVYMLSSFRPPFTNGRGGKMAAAHVDPRERKKVNHSKVHWSARSRRRGKGKEKRRRIKRVQLFRFGGRGKREGRGIVVCEQFPLKRGKRKRAKTALVLFRRSDERRKEKEKEEKKTFYYVRIPPLPGRGERRKGRTSSLQFGNGKHREKEKGGGQRSVQLSLP